MIKTDDNSLQGKHIVLGVTGSIAAYKSAELVRLCRKAGAEVKVVMTQAASEFITPLTLQTLSGSPVAVALLDADQESAMGHITLARWADYIVIAPASANTLAKLAQGRSDDLLSALCLASEATVFAAPAMNNKMWTHQATQSNLALLRERGMVFFGPDAGDQACGEQGEGRMMAPEDIVARLQQWVLPSKLSGTTVVVTAGPTHEPIDPVRYIANRSSGKMGFAIAQAAAEAGAKVILIAGPVQLATPNGVMRQDVETAQQMQAAVAAISDMHIFIACAAVADYSPADYQAQKIKKDSQSLSTLTLKQNPDIVAQVAQRDSAPFTVGFAAETEHVNDYAKKKLRKKGLNMIAANRVGEQLGFASDTNALHVFWSDGEKRLPTATKSHLARDLMQLIIERYDADSST